MAIAAVDTSRPVCSPELHEDAFIVFKDRVDVYARSVQHNYLGHYDTYAMMSKLTTHDAPSTFLDLGCGDASCLPTFMRGGFVKRLMTYTGVDLSAQQLAAAQKNLASFLPTSTAVQLHETDILTFLRQCADDSYDMVFASLSIHHLTTTEKADAFKHIARVLRPEGKFMWIDVIRRDGETLEAWVARMLLHVGNWTELQESERQDIRNHVTGGDMPDPVPVLKELAEEAGFTSCEVKLRTCLDLVGVMVFHN